MCVIMYTQLMYDVYVQLLYNIMSHISDLVWFDT